MKKLAVCLALSSALASCAPAVTRMTSPAGAPQCHSLSNAEVASLFDRWNNSLKTLDPAKVAANYKEDALLLPTVSNRPRINPEGIKDYFHHFLEKSPIGRIDSRYIRHGCNIAIDGGIYTFIFKDNTSVTGRYTFVYEYTDGQWLIASHHSSALPQDIDKEPWNK